jgi:excisionase family DNA binding protein
MISNDQVCYAIAAMNEALSPNRLYTLAEAADYLRVSPATVRRWIKQRRLPARKIGRDYRIEGRQLEETLEADATFEASLRPLTADSPLMKLIGVGDSGLSDVSERHDEYLAEEAVGHRDVS